MTRTRKHRIDTLFLAVGQMTVTWAYLEATIDACLDAIRQPTGGNVRALQLPRTSLSRKLEFLREWYMRRDDAAEHFPGFPEVLTTIAEGSEFRDALIRGVVVDMEAFETSGSAIDLATKQDHKKRQTKSGGPKVTSRQIRRFRDQTYSYAVLFGALAEFFQGDGAADDEERYDALRKLRRIVPSLKR
jgi:hypothetical protein